MAEPEVRKIATPKVNVVDIVSRAACCKGECEMPSACCAGRFGKVALRVVAALRRAEVLTDV